MKHITANTWDKLKERGIDPIRLGTGPDYDVSHEVVISHLREHYGIVVDVRFSNKNIMWPPYYSLIFKEDDSWFCHRVPQKCDNYTEMADYAIQTAIRFLP